MRGSQTYIASSYVCGIILDLDSDIGSPFILTISANGEIPISRLPFLVTEYVIVFFQVIRDLQKCKCQGRMSMAQEHNTENALSNSNNNSIRNVPSSILDDAAGKKGGFTIHFDFHRFRLKTRP